MDVTKDLAEVYKAPAVQEAVLLYQEAHLLQAGELPALPVLIEWLLDDNELQVARLEERMDWIRSILDEVGEVLPEDTVALRGVDVILARI